MVGRVQGYHAVFQSKHTRNTLPPYVNCKEKEIVHCDYFLTRMCKNTCGYAEDIGGIGVGGGDIGLAKMLNTASLDSQKNFSCKR